MVAIDTKLHDAPIRLGVVGLGGISSYYLKAVDAGRDFVLVAACDLDASSLNNIAQQYPTVVTTTQLADFAELSLDAVIIDTPPSTHFELCSQALQMGLHVCCEKPLVLDSAQARTLFALADSQGQELMCAYHRRYNKNLPVGDVTAGLRSVTAIYAEDILEHCGSGTWYFSSAADGGGCLADNGPNALDGLCQVVGPLELLAASVEQKDGYDVTAHLVATTGSGVPVTIDLDWAAVGEQKSMSFHYENGDKLCIDFLTGSDEFKSSLNHEYAGVMADFVGRIRGEAVSDRERELAQIGFIEKAITMSESIPGASGERH